MNVEIPAADDRGDAHVPLDVDGERVEEAASGAVGIDARQGAPGDLDEHDAPVGHRDGSLREAQAVGEELEVGHRGCVAARSARGTTGLATTAWTGALL